MNLVDTLSKSYRVVKNFVVDVRITIEDIFDWHESMIEDLMYTYKISPYNIGWGGFWSGVTVVLILQWIF